MRRHQERSSADACGVFIRKERLEEKEKEKVLFSFW
jgi:hypothetical protein